LLFSEESDFLEFIYDFWKLIANRLHCNYLEHPQSKNKGGQQHPILDFDPKNHDVPDQPIHDAMNGSGSSPM